MPRSSPAERFWTRVRITDGCWLWAGVAPNGYGYLSVDDRDTLAHRFSWELHRGPIPTGMHVLHRCDTPACVNPTHLFLGTHADNMADMAAKGRAGQLGKPGLRGAANGHAILTEEQAESVLIRVGAGETQAAVASDLGVSRQVVWLIVHGKSWAHLRARVAFKEAWQAREGVRGAS
jgi:hypothetical protein